MTVKVADIRANLNENIRHAASIIGKSKARRKVFAAIYRGKTAIKTVADIARATGLDRIRVLQEGGKLAGNGIVEQLKHDKQTGYKKDGTYAHHKNKILDLVDHPHKKSRYPTKQEPRSATTTTYRITVGRSTPQPSEITVDDVEAFKRVKSVDHLSNSLRLNKIPEIRIKQFLKRVIGEGHDFTDWGARKTIFTLTN